MWGTCKIVNFKSFLAIVFNSCDWSNLFWVRPLKIDNRKLNARDVCSLETHLEVFFFCLRS